MSDFVNDITTLDDEDGEPYRWGARGLWLGRPDVADKLADSVVLSEAHKIQLSEGTHRNPREGAIDTNSTTVVVNTKPRRPAPIAKKVPATTPSLVRHSRITVPAELRERIRSRYPGLDVDPAYWRFLGYMLYGTTEDRETRQLIISQPILAEIEGKLDLLEEHRYHGEGFLERFSRDVLPIKWTDYSKVERRARRVESFEIDQDILDAVVADLTTPWTPENRVYFDTGRVYSKKTQRAMIESDRNRVLEHLAEAGCEEARHLLEYLTKLPVNRFTKAIERHWDAAMAEAGKIEHEEVANEQIRKLRFIRTSPIPFYKPVEKSVRIFPLITSIGSLKRNVRDILVRDWRGFDLRSAQLAIIAHEWPVPEMQDFLASSQATDKSFWDELYDYFGIDRAERDFKDVLKPGLYGLAFGAEEDTIIEEMVDKGGTADIARQFLQHPLVQAMWSVRERRLAEIRQAGGAEDCFGRWIPIPSKWNKKRKRDFPNPRSVLAQLAQARELQLLYPVVELARTTDEFTILLWLHDGFYCDFKDASKKARWTKRIIEAVKTRADELGIRTELELK